MVFTHIPPFVFAIFFGLLALGWLQSRTRVVAPRRLVVLAVAMLGLSFYGVVAAFGLQALPLVAWLVGFGAAVAWGGSVLGPRGLESRGRAVLVPGSWVPMALMMGIFATKFALGFAAAVHAPNTQTPWFVLTISLVLGLLSGGFSARALVVHRFAKVARVAAVTAGTGGTGGTLQRG